MAKLNKNKMARDLQFLSSRFALAVDIALFSAVVYSLGAGLYFSAKVLGYAAYVPGAFIESNLTMLLVDILGFGVFAVLPVVGIHYARTHDGRMLPKDLQDLAKSNNKQDRKNIRKYIFGILLQGATIIAVAHTAGIIACKISGTRASLPCSISWVAGAGIAALILYLLSWFRASGSDGKGDSPFIRGTRLNTFETAKTRSLTLVDRPKQREKPGQKE